MKYFFFLFFFFLSTSSFSFTVEDCKKLYKVNDLFCSTSYWNKIGKMSRKGVIHQYKLLDENRVKGFIHNTSKKQRYVFIRYVLHDADLEPLAMDSHTISILKPGEKSKIDFIFHEKSKKPLNVIGSLIRIRNFDVK